MSVEGEDQELVVDVNEAADNVPRLPLGHGVLGLAVSIEPHELSAAVIRLTAIIIPDPVSAKASCVNTCQIKLE